MRTPARTAPQPRARPLPKRTHPPRVVITAGPTREYLDDVRFLSNASTGRLGHALAWEARRRGAAVTLVLGPCALQRIPGVTTVDVVSTSDLLTATRAAARGADLVIFAAAPADWRPVRKRRGKPSRAAGGYTLELRPTQDVAAALGRRKGRRVHVGFALEVRPDVARARRKLERKRFDAIVLNGPANFGEGGGQASWITPEGRPDPLPTASKERLARAVMSRSWALLGDPPSPRG